jgi:hypothetical protein
MRRGCNHYMNMLAQDIARAHRVAPDRQVANDISSGPSHGCDCVARLGSHWRRNIARLTRTPAEAMSAKAAIAAALDRFVSVLGPEARRGLGAGATRTPDRFTPHRTRPELNANFGYLPVKNRESGSARFARRAMLWRSLRSPGVTGPTAGDRRAALIQPGTAENPAGREVTLIFKALRGFYGRSMSTPAMFLSRRVTPSWIDGIGKEP